MNDTHRLRYSEPDCATRSCCVQFTLTAEHARKPIHRLTVREIKCILMEKCMHRFVDFGDGTPRRGDSEKDVLPISLRLGTRELEDDMTLWQYHFEFGERIVVDVSPQSRSSYARLTVRKNSTSTAFSEP